MAFGVCPSLGNRCMHAKKKSRRAIKLPRFTIFSSTFSCVRRTPKEAVFAFTACRNSTSLPFLIHPTPDQFFFKKKEEKNPVEKIDLPACSDFHSVSHTSTEKKRRKRGEKSRANHGNRTNRRTDFKGENNSCREGRKNNEHI